MPNDPKQPVEKIGIPPRPFLFTLDQVAALIEVDLDKFINQYVYFDGRTVGIRSVHLLRAQNIAHPQRDPDWRILDRELVRWMKRKGFKYHDRGYFSL